MVILRSSSLLYSFLNIGQCDRFYLFLDTENISSQLKDFLPSSICNEVEAFGGAAAFLEQFDPRSLMPQNLFMQAIPMVSFFFFKDISASYSPLPKDTNFLFNQPVNFQQHQNGS